MRAIPFRQDSVADPNTPTCLRVRRGNHYFNIGDWGSMGYIGGNPGTMKTTMTDYLAAAGLKGEEVLQFDFKLGDKCIIKADGEQPKRQFDKGCNRILELAGKDYDDRLIPYSFSGVIDAVERRNMLYEILAKYRKDLGLILVDGAAHFMADANDRHETKLVTSIFNKIAQDYSCMPLFVNHLTQRADKTSKLYGTSGTEIDKICTWGWITMQQGPYFGLTKGKFREDQAPPNLWCTHVDGRLVPEPYFPF